MKIELSKPFVPNGAVDEFDVRQMKKALEPVRELLETDGSDVIQGMWPGGGGRRCGHLRTEVATTAII